MTFSNEFWIFWLTVNRLKKGCFPTVQARFRKIERLTARVELPDTAVTAVVVDLLRELCWQWGFHWLF